MRANRKSPVVNRQSPAFVWFLVITGVAFVLRLIHLLQLRHNDPLFLLPQMDALYHHEWALAIAAGRPVASRPVPFRRSRRESLSYVRKAT